MSSRSRRSGPTILFGRPRSGHYSISYSLLNITDAGPTTYYRADLRHKYGSGGIIPLPLTPRNKSPFKLCLHPNYLDQVRTFLRKILVDVFAVEETHKNESVLFNCNADTIVTDSQSK